MTLAFVQEGDRALVMVDSKPCGYVMLSTLQALHDREGGTQQLYPAVGVIRTAPHLDPSPF